ncbi:hypothetical protein L6R49_18745 [Myxococcota bacterium]|nr:hypothetical protein [Myxococcota bacterium]
MNTKELAEFLASEEGLAVARALLGATAEPAGAPVAARPGPQPILEWRPVEGEDGLTFERPDAARCKPRRIGPKAPGALRVCLIGESMAAGFPLAPAYTPALVLEELLRQALGPAVEVIDLAMPNMGPTEQLRVCEAARQLRPDVFVLMTGNNWYYGLTIEPTASPEARRRYALRLAEGGPRSLVAEHRRQLLARAAVMVKHLVAAAHDVGARAVLTIPAVNHAWERRSPPPWLGGGGAAAWSRGYEAARRALAAGALEEAVHAAAQVEDTPLTGAPQRVRARALLASGDPAAAAEAAMAALDGTNWQNITFALPQTPAAVAALMRDGAEAGGYEAVELREILAEAIGGPYLDGRVFYDHCHLNVEGVRVAMSAVAAQIASPRLPEPLGWRALHPLAPSPTPLVAASASFQAAHWASQFFPALAQDDLGALLRAQVREALDADDALQPVLRAFIRLRSPLTSPGLHAALPQASRVPGVSAALVSRRLNAPLLGAILDVLRERGDAEVEDDLTALVQGYERALDDGIDLAHPRHQPQLWERTPLAWDDPNDRQGAPFYRALWPDSTFSLVCGASRDLSVALTARAPSPGEVTLLVNGAPVGALALGPGWRTWRGVLPQGTLRRGLNEVRLLWPALAVDEDEALRLAQRRLSLGVDADLLPVFGEVYSLRVTAQAGA